MAADFRSFRDTRRSVKVSNMQHLKSYVEIAIALFVLLDPIGAIPIFVTVTAHQTREETDRTINIAAATAFVALVAALLAGAPLLRIFGIRMASFEVGGGIVILLMAIAMLQARPRVRRTSEEADEAATSAGIAVVPLGVPIAAGPGTISAALIYGERATTWLDKALLVAIVGLVVSSFWIALRLAGPTRRLLGRTGINVVTRLLGLILIAVAVEFMARGLSGLFPGLGGPGL